MCAKMPIVIESVGNQGQRVKQGFEWPDDSATDRLSRPWFDIELLDLAKFNLPLYEEPTISRRAFTSCWAVTGASAVHPIPVLRRSRRLAL